MDTIPNQTRARTLLAIFKGDFPPCLWFYGPKGSGQEELAYEAFQGLYSEKDHRVYRKPKLDDIIPVRQWSLTHPDKKFKFILIEGVDKVSKEAANFLLKVIEESPSYVRWVLISESFNILQPLKSRSLAIPFRAFKDDEVEAAFGGSLFLKKEMARVSFSFVKSQLLDVLQSREYYKAYLFCTMLKRMCKEVTTEQGDDVSEMELIRNAYLCCCNIMADYYQKDVQRLSWVQETKNIIKNHVRSEHEFKVMFVRVL